MVILRPYFLQWRNRRWLGRDAVRNRHRDRLLFGIAAFISLVIYGVVYSTLRSRNIDPIFQAIIPTKLIELTCLIFFIMLVLSNSIAAVGNFYSADNLDLLLACPVPRHRIFFAKFAETLIETSAMFVVFFIPGVVAYITALKLSWSFFALVCAVAAPYLTIATALSIPVATLFVVTTSYFWRRGLLVMFVFAGSAGWAVYKMFTVGSKLEGEKNAIASLVQLVGIFENPNSPWSPTRWASDILGAAVHVTYAPLQAEWILLYTTAFGMVGLAYLFYDLFGFYVRSRATTHQVRSKSMTAFGRGVDIPRLLLERLYGLLPISQQIRCMMLKDITSMVRDRAQGLQMLLYCGIGTGYVMMFRFSSTYIQDASITNQLWWATLSCFNLLFSGFILTSLLNRLVYPSVSLEGRAFWILLTAPIDMRRMVMTKLCCWLPITMGLAVLLSMSATLAIGMGFLLSLPIALMTACTAIGCTGLAIGLGASFSTFEWESPNQISVGLGTIVLLLSNLMLVLTCLLPGGVVAFFSIVPQLRRNVGDVKSFVLMSFCLFFVIILNIFVARFACARGAKTLAESHC